MKHLHTQVSESVPVATLGPAGTDSENEARKHFQDVILLESFPAAVDYACAHGCYAVNEERAPDPQDIRSVALHSATRALARALVPDEAERHFVAAKPLGVRMAAAGEVDACVGSLDVVREAGNLSVVSTMNPTMVWCLYRSVSAS